MAKTKNKTSRRTQSIINLTLFVGIIIFINILANARIGGRSLYVNLDLTEDKRFTLTKSTRELLRELDDVVYVRVLLDGKFPAGFKRLQTSAREILDDFRGQSGYIEYEFEKEKVQNTFRLECEQLLVCVAYFFWTRECQLEQW